MNALPMIVRCMERQSGHTLPGTLAALRWRHQQFVLRPNLYLVSGAQDGFAQPVLMVKADYFPPPRSRRRRLLAASKEEAPDVSHGRASG
jgi:hypothetical protein